MWLGRLGRGLGAMIQSAVVALLKCSTLEELDATEEIASDTYEPRVVARVGCRATLVNGAWTKVHRKFLALQALAPVLIGEQTFPPRSAPALWDSIQKVFRS